MAFGSGDLVLCSATLARETGFRERVEAAAGAGFAGLSLWCRDHRRARAEGLTDADMRAMLDEHGLAVAEIDLACRWLPGAADVTVPPELDAEEVLGFTDDDVLRIAEAVGARSV